MLGLIVQVLSSLRTKNAASAENTDIALSSHKIQIIVIKAFQHLTLYGLPDNYECILYFESILLFPSIIFLDQSRFYWISYLKVDIGELGSIEFAFSSAKD